MSDISGLIKQSNDIIQMAYDKGYKQGIADGNINDGTFAEKVKEAYQNGYKDATEQISKGIFRIVKASAKECKSQNDSEPSGIRIGDEIKNLKDNRKGVVTRLEDDYHSASVLMEDGSYFYASEKTLEQYKTKKNYPVFEHIFAELRGE